MRFRRSSGIGWVAAAMVLACGGDGDGPVGNEPVANDPVSLVALSGLNQEGTTGQPLAEPFVVELQDAVGGGVADATLTWQVTSGVGELSASSVATDADGRASTTLTPRAPGSHTVTARLGALEPAVFGARASGTGGFDTGRTGTTLEGTVGPYMASNSALANLSAILFLMSDALLSSPPSAGYGPLEVSAFLGGLRGRLPGLVDGLRSGERLALPSTVIGTTWIWDPTWGGDGGYRRERDRDHEAPANGVRFILYEIDSETGQPDASQEIGYFDVAEHATPPTVDLTLTGVIDGQTLLSVEIDGSLTETSLVMAISGYLSSDGQTQLPVGVDFRLTDTDFALDFAFEFDEFILVVSDRLAAATGIEHLDATLTGGATGDELAIALRFDDQLNVMSGSVVTFNGVEVAVFGGALTSLTLGHAAGEPLTQQELQDVATIVESVLMADTTCLLLALLGMILVL